MVLSAGDKAGILNAYPQSPTAAAGQAAQRATVVQRANNPKLAESLRSDLKARVDDFHDIANGHTKIQVLVP
jgi:hypothetical protein